MSEEKKDYQKTKELTPEEVKQIVSTDFGVKLRMTDIKAGNHIVLKIEEPVKTEQYEYPEGSGTFITKHSITCRYKPRGFDGIIMQVQAGENAVNRLIEKNPDNSYVGKYAYFTRTSFNGKYPQFINIIEDYHEPKSKDELFTKSKVSFGETKEENKKVKEVNTTPSSSVDLLSLSADAEEVFIPSQTELDLMNRIRKLPSDFVVDEANFRHTLLAKGVPVERAGKLWNHYNGREQ